MLRALDYMIRVPITLMSSSRSKDEFRSRVDGNITKLVELRRSCQISGEVFPESIIAISLNFETIS